MVRICFCLLVLAVSLLSSPLVELKRTPDNGIQPQVAVDSSGVIHVLFFKGNPAAGDLFYCRSRDGETFSKPVRVNATPGSAVAIGNIRGGRIAVGPQGQVYVIWNGSQTAASQNRGRTPLLFARLNRQGTAFEPDRNLIHFAYGLDGGSAITTDASGRVYVFWHAPIPGKQGEPFRRVWMTRSEDGGKTFSAERIIFDQPTGACGCCSLDAGTNEKGDIFVLFRTAWQTVHRDMYLLESRDHGDHFAGSDIAKWDVSYCVMSSEAFARGVSGMYAAWEDEKRVQFGRVDDAGDRVTQVVTAPGSLTQKYPALAENRSGDVLLAWTEGMRWSRGGSLRWQVFNRSLKPIAAEAGSAAGVPAWSLVAAYARQDGRFVILY